MAASNRGIQAGCPSGERICVLSTANKVSGNYSSGRLELGQAVTGCKQINLLYASIPNTVYVFEGDVFAFEEQAGGGELTIALTGYYTAASLALYLQQQMIAESLASGNTYTYVVTYSTDTGKMTFTESGANNFRINADNTGFPNYKLGFDAAKTTYATTVDSDNVVNIYPPKVLILALGPLSNAKSVITTCGSGGGQYVIPMNTNSFGIVDFFDQSGFDNDIVLEKGEVLHSIEYRLMDASTGLAASIQSDWQITLRIK